MKFLYADSLDYVTPNYDFSEDRMPTDRQPYWDDEFSHEHLDRPPYDGVLISRGIVGDHKLPGKYSQSQGMRFRREGARKFLRLDDPKYEDLIIFGDCGAFTYVDYEKPPYSPSEILDFYDDGGFSHGCSPDHVIFEYERNLSGMEDLPDPEQAKRVRDRYEITLENAAAFYKESPHVGQAFTPLGVVQGWSPGSMAEAARRLVKMGYDYIALGGMVPLSIESIRVALDRVRELIGPHPDLHILGFGKIDQIDQVVDYGITSIDTTSPMIRAFKDNRRNFFMPAEGSEFKYYTAIRIPQATENKAVKTLIKKGHFTQEYALQLEAKALKSLREYDKGKAKLEDALDAVMAYHESWLISPKTGDAPSKAKLETIRADCKQILEDTPWKKCNCAVCRSVSIEVAIFRASNRNKRRGMHNLHIFYEQLQNTLGKSEENEQKAKIQGHPRTSK